MYELFSRKPNIINRIIPQLLKVPQLCYFKDFLFLEICFGGMHASQVKKHFTFIIQICMFLQEVRLE